MAANWDDELHISAPETVSVGLPAVRHALQYARTQMGITRGGATLLTVNQVKGFDCPGCAWPDPPAGERSHSEFCENGAKAVAWEATHARVDREFFAAHSIG